MPPASAAVAQQPPQAAPRPPRPTGAAWLASLAWHLLLAVVGTLAFPPRPAKPPTTTPAGIVLVRRSAPPTPWFQDAEARPEASSTPTAASATPAAARPRAFSAADPAAPARGALTMLPDERDLAVLPGLGLPVADATLPADPSGWPLALAPLGGRTGRPRLGLAPEDIAAILAEDAAQPRFERPTGPTATLQLFGLPPATGRSFVLVIDRSSSMGAGGLDVLRSAAKELNRELSRLTPEQTVQVVAYHHAAVYATGPHLVPATEENREKLVDFVANLAAYGQTEHVQGLIAGLKLKPEVLLLLTDGGDPAPDGQELQLVRRLAAGRTQIHCLHFGRGPTEGRGRFLQWLAQQTGGQYHFVDGARR